MSKNRNCPFTGHPCPGTCFRGLDESEPHSHASNPYHGVPFDDLLMASWVLLDQYYEQMEAILFRVKGDAIDVALAKGIQESQGPLLAKLRLIYAEIQRQDPGLLMAPWPDMEADGILLISVVSVQAEEPARAEEPASSAPAAETPRKRHAAPKPFHRNRTAKAASRCKRPADGKVRSPATMRSTAAPNVRWPGHRAVHGEKMMAV